MDSLLAATLAAVNPDGWPVLRMDRPGPPPTVGGPAIIVIANANDPAFDRSRRGLVEIGVIGGADPVWIGATEPPPLPPGDNGALVISFYTRATRYETFANRLRESLDRQGVGYELIGVDVPGTWEMVCAFKAEFIREQWGRTDRPVIWLDADATLVAPLGLLAAPGADFAIAKHGGWKLSAGTILFGRSPAAEALLDRWVLRCRADPLMWDQNHLDAAWADVSATMPLVTRWLPPAYLAIWDSYDAARFGPPVVMQHQASRGEASAGRKKEVPPPQPEELRNDRRNSRWRRGAASRFHGVPDRAPVPPSLARQIQSLAEGALPLVDIGCGTGALAHSFPPGSYIGTDMRPEAILAARSAMPDRTWRILMEEYPFPAGGSVLLLDLLSRVSDPARADILARAAVAAPRLILCDRPGLAEVCIAAGWQVVSQEPAEGGRDAVVLRR